MDKPEGSPPRRHSSRQRHPRRFSSDEESPPPQRKKSAPPPPPTPSPPATSNKKRGRPVGSKNKPKEKGTQEKSKGRGRGGKRKGAGRKGKQPKSAPLPEGMELPPATSEEDSTSEEEGLSPPEKRPRTSTPLSVFQSVELTDTFGLSGDPNRHHNARLPRMDSTMVSRRSYGQIKADVEGKLPGMMEVWLEHLKESNTQSRLWGIDQTDGFLSHSLTLALYKDLFGDGYAKILSSVDVGFKTSPKSLQHNTCIIRGALFAWALSVIEVGTAEDWNSKKHFLSKKPGLDKVNLLIDSSDFRLPGRSSVSKKDPSWSYKLNSPAQRYQVVCDASLQVRGIWGGYSPKIYDGHWVNMMKHTLVKEYSGARILGDCHYETGNSAISSIGGQGEVQFFTAFPKPRGRKSKRDKSEGKKSLTAAQKKWNKSCSHTRGRMEEPFSHVKQKWKALNLFLDGEEQQNYLVFIALAEMSYNNK
jgi:DDE superfamily endonuclease